MYSVSARCYKVFRGQATVYYNNWWQICRNASYFTRIANRSPFTHLWFLAVELQIYFIWPLIFMGYIWLSDKVSKRAGTFLFLILAVISFVLMGVFYSEENLTRVYYGTDTRISAFLMGAFCGALGSKGNIFRAKRLGKGIRKSLFTLGVFCVFVMYLFANGESVKIYRGGMVFACVIFGLMIFGVTETELRDWKLFSWKPVQLLSQKSYLIYLWHFPILFLFHIWRNTKL